MSFINFFVVNTCSIRTKLDYTCSNYTHYVLFQLTYLLRISTIYSLPSLFILIHQNRDHKAGGKVLFSLWQQRVIACPLLSNLQKYFGNRSRLYHGICLKSIALLLQFRISCSIFHLFLYSNATEWSQNLYKKINFSTN